ncbi:MAG TPA: tyrosine--tRNA ligase [Victivallales bacterium]|nr:tyrosine--tRNA ligase [Victivallales bacterium]
MRTLDLLKSRGYIYQTTDDEALAGLLDGKLVFYAGFDPTADSLHIGHLLPVMLMRTLAKRGHTPVILVGGGTALIGDPSGKKEARKMLDPQTVALNSAAIKKQLSGLIQEDCDKAVFVDNSEWLTKINMIQYLRDIGSKFSVNKMLSAESVKQRLQDGISYLEFSYMILQAYDFLHLNEKYNCLLQIGGQDQWGNIVAGTDIIRRFKSTQAYGVTVPLLLSSSTGEKFGKTADGAVWLSPDKTSNFDYYQFWRNIPDTDCGRMLRLFTDLPEEEISELEKLEPPSLNRAKEILAFECTKLVRGEDVAVESFVAAGSKFGFADPDAKIPTSSSITKISNSGLKKAELPTYGIKAVSGEDSVWIIRMFTESGLCSSNGEARRLIKGGGAYINGKKIEDPEFRISCEKIRNEETIIAAGKKNFKKIVLE